MDIIKNKYSIIENVSTIAILADPACRSGYEKRFSRLLKKVSDKYSPQLYIAAGDMTSNSYHKEYKKIIKELNKYPGKLAAVPGDHDRPLKNFCKYFGSTRKVIDVDKWRIIGINTANRMFLKREADWIENNIKNNSIIFSHMPPEAEGWTFHSLWGTSSDHFLKIIKKHRKKIKGMYFGHIHGYSERNYLDIPMIITGGIAESFKVKNNSYAGNNFIEMVIFDTKTSSTELCKLKHFR